MISVVLIKHMTKRNLEKNGIIYLTLLQNIVHQPGKLGQELLTGTKKQ